MKILHFVADHLPPGGFQAAVHSFCNGLSGLGHEVTLLCKKRRTRDKPSLFETEDVRYAVRQYWLPRTRGIGHRYFGSRAIRRAARDFEPDIIHCTMGWPCPAWALDAFPAPPRGLVAMFQGADIQLNPEFNYGLRLNESIDRDVKRTLRECPNLLTISNAMRDELIAAGASPARVNVIPNGVDCNLYASPAPPSPVSGGYIFAMGRLIPKKGYDLLLQAYAKAFPDPDNAPNLYIAGEGPEKDNLEAACRSLGISRQVRFIGYIGTEEKIAWLRNALIFAHPARREAFGIVNAEALAAGLPVIAFACDGLLDIVEDGKCGFLIPPYDTDAFAGKLREVCSSRPLREQLSTRARERARLFDWTILSSRLANYYNSILETPDKE